MASAEELQTLDKLLTNDVKATQSLLALLEEEQEALKSRNVESLEKIVEDKAPLLAQLEESAVQRTLWVQRITNEDNAEDAWKDILESDIPPALKTNWESLKQLLESCKLKNEVNGKMLARNQQVFSRLLDIMRGQQVSKNLYNASGAASGGSRSKIVGEA